MTKQILITGAASGFGRLTALALLAEGHRVYATMRDIQGKNAEPARALRDAGAHLAELDVTDTQSITHAIATVQEEAGAIDVLINNAGIAASGISESFSAKQFHAILDVNVVGVFRLTQAVLPVMRKHNDGLIINIGSILGRVTFPFFGLYGASKYAVEAMTDSFAYELSQLGIDVALIQPSAYPTNMYANALSPEHAQIATQYGDLADIPEDIGATIASMFASETPPEPGDVAAAAVSLINQARGSRPRRVVVGASFGADRANELISPIQAQLIEALGLHTLASLTP